MVGCTGTIKASAEGKKMLVEKRVCQKVFLSRAWPCNDGQLAELKM